MQLHLRLAVPVSLLAVRVDDFKLVKDTLGYAASDELLRSVGARIQASVRADDTVARMGGDEFAILVEDRPEVAAQVAKRLAQAFDSALAIGDQPGLRAPEHWRGDRRTARRRPVHRRGSARPGRGGPVARRANECDRCADFYSRDGRPSRRRQTFRDGVARLQLLWDLRRAIDDRLLTLVYQPQFGLPAARSAGQRRYCVGNTPLWALWSPANSCRWCANTG